MSNYQMNDNVTMNEEMKNNGNWIKNLYHMIRPTIESELRRFHADARKKFPDYDEMWAKWMIQNYLDLLQFIGYTDRKIAMCLRNIARRMIKKSKTWDEWADLMCTTKEFQFEEH